MFSKSLQEETVLPTIHTALHPAMPADPANAPHNTLTTTCVELQPMTALHIHSGGLIPDAFFMSLL